MLTVDRRSIRLVNQSGEAGLCVAASDKEAGKIGSILAMDSSSSSAIPKTHDKESMVDPFLVEALQNPRHRLTILRMELDVQRFLKNPELQQFEFQQFPTSYLRLAAHRVAHHYGLTTAVQEVMDGQGNRIVVRKSADSRYPAVRLSEILAKHLECEKSDKIRVVIKPRPNSNSGSADNELGKRSPSRTVEDREEEYERARARIFSSPDSPVSGDNPLGPTAGKDLGLTRNENELNRNLVNDPDKSCIRDGSNSRVAIIRDVEKDRFDPDYDRSYGRYIRSLRADQSFGLTPFQMEKSQLPYMQYGNHACFPPYGLVPRTHSSVNYGLPSNAVMTPFGAMGLNMGATDAAYLQWPNQVMMYAQSYEQFRHAISQAPFSQHPPSLNHSQNLMNRS